MARARRAQRSSVGGRGGKAGSAGGAGGPDDRLRAEQVERLRHLGAYVTQTRDLVVGSFSELERLARRGGQIRDRETGALVREVAPLGEAIGVSRDRWRQLANAADPTVVPDDELLRRASITNLLLLEWLAREVRGQSLAEMWAAVIMEETTEGADQRLADRGEAQDGGGGGVLVARASRSQSPVEQEQAEVVTSLLARLTPEGQESVAAFAAWMVARTEAAHGLLPLPRMPRLPGITPAEEEALAEHEYQEEQRMAEIAADIAAEAEVGPTAAAAAAEGAGSGHRGPRRRRANTDR